MFTATFTTEHPAGRVGKVATIKSLKIPLHECFIIDDSCEVIEEAIAAGITCARVKLQRKPSVVGDKHHIVGWFADALPIVGRWTRRLDNWEKERWRIEKHVAGCIRMLTGILMKPLFKGVILL